MPIAKPHKTIVHKSEKKIARFDSHKFKRIQTSWRKVRGIDNPLRRHYKGHGATPGVGYRTDKETRYMDKDGFKRVLVRNVAELEPLMLHNRTYKAVIASTVGAKKRKEIVERAKELDVIVVNRRAKLTTEEKQ